MTPERVLVWLGLVFGFALVIVQPPVQTPDESHHLWRAFQISEGGIVAELRGEGDATDAPFAHLAGGHLPAGLHGPNIYFGYPTTRSISLPGTLAALRLRSEPADRFFLGFSNTAIHSPVTYAPQVLAIAIAKRLTSSVLAYYYAGRVANLVAAIVLLWVAVRLAPIGKWIFVAVALTPMTLSLFASLNADAITMSSCFLFIALVLRCAVGPEPGPGALSGIIAAAAAMALSKQIYLPLFLLLAIVPVRRLGGIRRSVAFGVLFAAVVGSLWVGWAMVARSVFTPADGTDPSAIVDLLIRHPGELPLRIVRTILENGVVDAREFLGMLGLQTIPLPWLLLGPHVVVLIVVAALDPAARTTLAPWQRAIAAAVWAASALAIFVASTVLWGRPEDRIVDIQGRYFLPIAPVLLLVFHRPIGPNRLPWLRWALPRLTTAWLGFLLASTVVLVGVRSWGPAPLDARPNQRVNLAEAFLWNGQAEEARRELEAALNANPRHARAHYNLARMSLAQGDLDTAIRHLRVLYEQAGLRRELGVGALLSWALATQHGGSPEQRLEAVRIARDAVRAAPEDTRARDALEVALAAASRSSGTAKRPFDGVEENLASQPPVEAHTGPVWAPGAPLRTLVPRSLDPDHEP